MYDFDNTLIIFVDPPAGMESRIKMIEISPNFDTYLIKNEHYNPQKQGRIIFHDRFIDNYCDVAMINSDEWMKLLPDTIHHMRQNCIEGTTTFDNKEIIPITTTEFNRLESPSWKELQWFEMTKKECKELC